MDIFEPVQLGALALRNRVVMAPMTRSRADADAVPTPAMVEYYRQRASAGMIVTEGIAPSADGLGYCRTPGIYNQAQIDGWREVTAAVHERGGTIVAQLMHVGRVANAYNKPAGSETVAPSPIQAKGTMYTDAAGMQPFDLPRQLTLAEIPAVIAQYRQATGNAIAAGFDGVELHCTSGYLPAQFLSTGTNQRSDSYGGSIANRARFALETLAVMAAEAGAHKLGMRICPDNPFNDLADADPQGSFDYLLAEAARLDLAYLHVIRMPKGRVDNLALGQHYFPDRVIANESYDLAEARSLIGEGAAAAVSFGRAFIANPDLVERWRHQLPLSEFDMATLYTPGEQGYTSYPKAQA